MQKHFLTVIGLSQGVDLKRSGTELTIANQMDLGIELQRKCCITSQDPVIRYSNVPVLWGEDKQEAKAGGKTSIHFNGRTENIELLLPVGQKAPEKPSAPGQLDKQEILAQPLLAEMQANEERQENRLQEYEQRFENLSEDQKLSRLCSEAGLRIVEVGQFFYALPSPRGKETQSLWREYTLPRDQKGTRIKGWIQSRLRFGPVSHIKVWNQHGRYSIEVQVQSLFQDQTLSWIRIVNGKDKFVRGTMPIQEDEKGSGKRSAKARQIYKPSSTSGWDFTLIEQRQWMDIETYDPCRFQVSKFITR